MAGGRRDFLLNVVTERKSGFMSHLDVEQGTRVFVQRSTFVTR